MPVKKGGADLAEGLVPIVILLITAFSASQWDGVKKDEMGKINQRIVVDHFQRYGIKQKDAYKIIQLIDTKKVVQKLREGNVDDTIEEALSILTKVTKEEQKLTEEEKNKVKEIIKDDEKVKQYITDADENVIKGTDLYYPTPKGGKPKTRKRTQKKRKPKKPKKTKKTRGKAITFGKLMTFW